MHRFPERESIPKTINSDNTAMTNDTANKHKYNIACVYSSRGSEYELYQGNNASRPGEKVNQEQLTGTPWPPLTILQINKYNIVCVYIS